MKAKARQRAGRAPSLPRRCPPRALSARPAALTCVRGHGQRRREVFSGREVRGRLRGGRGAAVAQAPALRQQMRRRREVAAIHAGPRPRPAAASREQRGRGPGATRCAGGAREARRERRPGHRRRRRRRGRSAGWRAGLLGGRPCAEPAAAVWVHSLRREAEETRSLGAWPVSPGPPGPTARLPTSRARAGPPASRVPGRTRTVPATLGPGEPGAPLAASPSRPRGSLRRGRRGKRLLAPRGDKTPNLRSHHARTHSHTHPRAHPLPSPAAQRRLRGSTGSARAPSPSRRVQPPRHPPRPVTVLIKRVILLIVTQEFFFITFRFSPFPSPHAFSSSFF